MKIEYKIEDSLEYMKNLFADEYDLVLTDPPYNVSLDYGELVDDDKPYIEYRKWCTDWFNEARRVAKTVILTPGNTNLRMWCNDILWPKGFIIWYCPNQQSWSKLGGSNSWEPILVYGKISVRDNVIKQNIMGKGDLIKNRKHPCPKPYQLYVKILKNIMPRVETVLDPFVGSGTLLKAARIFGCDALGIEINPDYEDEIKARCYESIPNIEEYL